MSGFPLSPQAPVVFFRVFMLTHNFGRLGTIALVSSLFAFANAAAAVITVASNDYVIDTPYNNNNHGSFVYLYPGYGFASASYNNTTTAIKLQVTSNGLWASNEYTGRVAASDSSGSDWFATKFAQGELIEGTDFNGSGVINYLNLPGGGVHNQFALGGPSGYIGFSFTDGSSLTHYGWARLSVTDDGFSSYSMTLHEWAYETVANTAIAAGSYSSIPEPATVGLIAALGALGVAAVRRRKSTR